MYDIPTAAEWDAFVTQHPRGHLLQLSAWGDLKSAYGWDAGRIALRDEGHIIAGAQILFRKLPLRLGTMAYIPFGGYVTASSQWPALWHAIDAYCQEQGAAFLKWEPGLYLDDERPDFAVLGFRGSPQTIQPPNTILLDISDSDDDIMARMNQGTRRKIRKSLKNDIRYYEAEPGDVTKFTNLMHITGERNEFGVHEPDYYAMQYDLFAPEHAALILAEHEGQTLAGVFVFAVGDTAQYISGASSNIDRNLMASYGVQWKAIEWAKVRGCRYYDMWGIPDEPEATLEAQFQDRSDGLWGVYGFKRGWGGQVIRSAGAWDMVYNALIYRAYLAAIMLRG
ncbi:peptidoglycan bridge formation glycyltransferase FemA/FemB family protein [Phototrophicus methaneseepsis]|uniref:Peptidoglycan bridge formation glycyltransferase FemA/FemB family protein n=1 Tax=Phototrophicus methaneseepsis TaxID=2710758 RepID=A0A7S8E7P3_9CHLR|nr:peptidoglycan bridge formation glycyltransferase FemA/FemB family protein [Phototrophicus methaneseepsis]QPC81910.1 peptidoglycan bridge formation glycyltransferase FemA/FemB family protein [Phototrophicus methaneseepsis]